MNKRMNGFKIMFKLIGLIKPLWHVMVVAVLFGVLGYLCAIFLTILAGAGIVEILAIDRIWMIDSSLNKIIYLMAIFAILRGFLHYIEQYSNHYIAFKLLAIIRGDVFDALRKLSPAKVEGRDKGNLISIITSDIELLEVFYAHTISPIIIALIASIVMVLFIGSFNIYAGLLAFISYVVIGIVIPLINGKKGKDEGFKLRNDVGDLNSYVLESLRGLDEIINYNQGNKRLNKINDKNDSLVSIQRKLNTYEAKQRSITNMLILLFSLLMLLLMLFQYKMGYASFEALLISTISMMASFGPVLALAALSNNLNHTLAAGQRVLDLLQEKPIINEVKDGIDIKDFESLSLDNASFAYDQEKIIDDLSLAFKKNQIIGIYGPSGLGKSTILKLLMRFWDVDEGSVKVNGIDIKKINTSSLRKIEGYVTQDTHLFNDTIANNIAIGKLDATKEEIIEAAKKASIHDFIMSLPNGYDSKTGELGDMLSGGERQRIGLARAFIHKADVILLDEPTSNLDALNEGIILKSLKEYKDNQTIVLVSHRPSTLNVSDYKYELK